MVALTRRYQRKLDAITKPTAAAVQRVWDGLDRHDEENIAAFERGVAKSVAAAKAATFATSVGYFSLLGTKRPPSLKVAHLPTEYRARDPFISFWASLKGGNSPEVSLEAGHQRAGAAVVDFVTTTGRRTGDLVASATGQQITGWRRVLSQPHCEWCEEVAAQTYSSAESADFGHNRCSCTVAPIYGDVDPGASLNADAPAPEFT